MESRLLFKILSALLLGLILTGCKNLKLFENREIRGFLKTDKSAAGNEYLEVWDTEVKDHRFIHPGRKIILLKTKYNDVLIKLMDSRRVLLSTIRVPISKIKVDKDNIFISGHDMNQNWDLVGKSVSHFLMTEYLETRHTKKCPNTEEIAGVVWQAQEHQAEYTIEFRNLGSDKVWGSLSAIGNINVSSDRIDLDRRCSPKRIVHRAPLETFQ